MSANPIRKSFIVELNNQETFRNMFEQIKELKLKDNDTVYLYVADRWGEIILILQNFPQNFNLTYLICHCDKKKFSDKNEYDNMAKYLTDKIHNIINLVKPRQWNIIDSQNFCNKMSDFKLED